MGAHHQQRPGGPPIEPRLQGLGRAGLHVLQTQHSFNFCCSPAQSTCLPSPAPSLVGIPGTPESSWALKELHIPQPGLTTAGTSVPCSSCGRCAPGFRLSASPWGTGSGVRAGWSTLCRAAASDPCLASQNTSSHRGVTGHLWERPQRMSPIATCLPVLGRRGGKKERSSPRQALPGAVVSECCGGAGLAGEGQGQEVVVEV